MSHDIRHLRANQGSFEVIGCFGLISLKPLDNPSTGLQMPLPIGRLSPAVGGHKNRWHDRAQERLTRYQVGINPDPHAIAKGLRRDPCPAHAKFRVLCPGYADMVLLAKASHGSSHWFQHDRASKSGNGERPRSIERLRSDLDMHLVPQA